MDHDLPHVRVAENVTLDTFRNEIVPGNQCFHEALGHARVAEVEPGDAIYVPYFWWHHVRTLDDLNILVNFWWSDAEPDLGSPFDALLHAILAIRDLPQHQREAWHTMFDHYAFGRNGDPVAHLPSAARGALGAHDREMRQKIRMMLLGAIGRQAGLGSYSK